MAYVFGTLCGRTPLIKLSPKKTWEGFIGGGLATIILGAIVSTIIKLQNNSLIHQHRMSGINLA